MEEMCDLSVFLHLRFGEGGVLEVIVKRLVSVWWGRFSSYWWKRGQASLDTETTCKWKHTMGIYKHSSMVLFGHQGAIDKIQTSHLGGIDGLVYGMIENR